jgi:acid phosphatase type 7
MSRGSGVAPIIVLFLITGCGGNSASPPPGPLPPGPDPVPPPTGPAVLVGAGDIGMCGTTAPEATAKLLDSVAGTVFAAGDIAYPDGTQQNIRDCYEPNWGRHKARTRPVPGNHDYHTPGAAPYFEYFGANAGSPGSGYYSYDLGSWHVVALNSNIPIYDASSQIFWLRQDLEATRATCVVAYWHHPLFASGTNGGSPFVVDLWRVLYEYGVEVVLNGHEHRYERYAPMNPNGGFDLSRGIVEFVVGTGGGPLYPLRQRHQNLIQDSSTHGVLKLTLTTGSYAWEFMPIAGQGYRDSGTGTCH